MTNNWNFISSVTWYAKLTHLQSATQSIDILALRKQIISCDLDTPLIYVRPFLEVKIWSKIGPHIKSSKERHYNSSTNIN